MSRITLPSQFQPANAAATNSNSKSLNDLGTEDFLELLVAELQNQDPLEPTDNSQLLQQISQIRQITSNDSMIETLSSVQSGQEISTASGLIGKHISALSQDSEEVSGQVDRVSMGAASDNGPRQLLVHVGEHKIPLNNIREITPSIAG